MTTRPTKTMFDTHTIHLERLGTKCGGYRLEKLLHHDQIRTCYLALGADEQLFEIQIFEENCYAAASVRQAIENYINSLQQKSAAGVVGIIEFGYTPDGDPFLVANKPPGQQLSALLEEQKVISLEHSMTIGIEVSRILMALHRQGIFHGCLSPRNIFLNENEIIVGDVGTGYIVSLSTRPALDAIGIPLYMSPEQLEGKPSNETSDTYALALVLYECVTGLPPHSSTSVTELALQRRKPPPSLSSATDVAQPSEVEVFFRKALSSKASERFPDADDLNQALLSVQRRNPIAPDIDSGKIPHRYKILRHPSPTNLTEMQRIDAVAAQSGVKANQRRATVVSSLFALCASIAVGLYLMTLTCLASMHQELGAITKDLPDKIATTSGSTNFVVNPPKISKGELSGETKLDSVLKFCTGYGLRADNAVGDFSKITQLNKLEFLSLSGTAVSDADLKSFIYLPLKYLDIGNCKNLTSSGFQAVQQMQSLRCLRAEELKISPTDIERLSPALLELRLKSCHVSDQCLERLPVLKNLRKLDLTNNQITRASFDSLARLPRLYLLDLQNNPKLTRDDQIELAKLMPHTVIRFDFAIPTNKSLFENIKLDKLLKKWNGIELNAQGTNGDFSKIAKLENLQAVDLSRSTAKDLDLRGFGNLPLRYIGLDSCRIGSSALKELQDLPNLVILEASASGLRDDDLVYLNPKLKDLDLSSCHITDKGIANLSKLKHLVSLKLNNNGLTTDSFKGLRKLKTLRMLDLRDCSNIRTEEAKIFEDSLRDTVVMLNRIRR